MARASYKKSGVDIDAADAFISGIKTMVRTTRRPEVLGSIGGFSGLFAPKLKGMKKPVLVASSDGVGTKILLADILGRYDTVGIDLVAMSVDDVVVVGAEPLFFLDYIAVGRLRKDRLLQVMKGIVRGCREAGCTLLGGETAELPGLYPPETWDLAGFCIGIVDRDRIIDGRSCRRGDVLVGLSSNGLHSNGYSLARKVFSPAELRGPIGRMLLRPTRIYCRAILDIMKKNPVKAMAHITGGGFLDNIPRILPPNLDARISKTAWTVPPIFRKIQEKGNVLESEMFRTFNMGIGMVLVMTPAHAEAAVPRFDKRGMKARIIGELAPGERRVLIS